MQIYPSSNIHLSIHAYRAFTDPQLHPISKGCSDPSALLGPIADGSSKPIKRQMNAVLEGAGDKGQGEAAAPHTKKPRKPRVNKPGDECDGCTTSLD